jgi:hypothetical protein
MSSRRDVHILPQRIRKCRPQMRVSYQWEWEFFQKECNRIVYKATTKGSFGGSLQNTLQSTTIDTQTDRQTDRQRHTHVCSLSLSLSLTHTHTHTHIDRGPVMGSSKNTNTRPLHLQGLHYLYSGDGRVARPKTLRRTVDKVVQH